ncbi:hypothetical protein D092_06580 [Rhodococcus ruber Chol-4]|uniref:Uncharacterized protein n=1 Tax=Rhodococcus ruber TaxID=1830 RepID=A0A098BV23_9NOCA|nr:MULTISPECIES: hypothetical protein [Rhodococcus]MDO2379483.1 hypothetical protein [Rhodococcus ruber]NGR06056.1 hypothetical protein [bacterium SGD-2]RIK11943.1 MAG: hypothetical protein DCC47_09085 [Acidobacteriota bacterium]ATQ28219.1 hypothetical protein CS378_05415 [Rhodococcus ruber]AUM17167.1 hypothetical protein CSW53_11950 [Rhodococcus ruber]
MTEPHDEPNLDDVITPTEHVTRDRREHGKAPERLDDDYLEYRTEQERIAAGLDDYDPDRVPPATD